MLVGIDVEQDQVRLLAACGADRLLAVGPDPTSTGICETDVVDDLEIVRRIGELSDEEHRLERVHAGDALSEEDQDRLRAIEVALDQCWDLLRQRRARRGVGQDPDDAVVRPADTVEGYQQ